MRICPIFFNSANISDKGQSHNINFSLSNKNHLLNYQNSNDVFVRLAIASSRDANIEQELKQMELI